MESDDSESESLFTFGQLVKLLGKGAPPRKVRKSNAAERNIEDLVKLLEASLAADGESEPENFSGESTEDIPVDAIESFNMGYEDYLKATEQKTPSSSFAIPHFKSHTFKFMTPALENVLKSSIVPSVLTQPALFGLHQTLTKRISKLHQKSELDENVLKDRNRLRYLFHCLNSYVDIHYAGCKVGDLASVRFLYALHTANHIYKSLSSTVEQSDGFTRPRVLYLCGLKCMAADFINHLITLFTANKEDPRFDKFMEEYYLPDDEASAQESSFLKTKKSFDFVETFSGNQEDAFKMGLQYQAGKLRLYTPFYSSDIIVASPLGLKILIQEDEDYDYLSSIEVILIDRLDVLKFQNWRFFMDVFEKLNQPLKKWRDADVSRLRHSTIDGQSELYRQTVCVSCTEHAIFNSFFKRLPNRRGGIKLSSKPRNDFVLLGCRMGIQQLFIKVSASSVKESETALLNYFLKSMLTGLHGVGNVLVVLGDYTHFLRIQNDLKLANFEYLPCHESTTGKQMLIARQQFQSGNANVLITTSRLLFFKRYLIKGTSRVIFVIPPDYHDLYREAFRMMDLSKKNSIVTLYTRYHAQQLEPIAGTEKTSKLLSADDTKVTEFY
ncbi:uncharacterized protein BBOV_IV006620 [Babesia bovis T2Bo]|uniref:uncharacterized protein n=1 Tax=Babesia bovis T2Bo TaxID=484906 RepID=UPI001D2A1FE7|nr:uncharacterized protein BBOV_IV006620 [Babesia bovis T2Bo]EDO07018.2 hypothetical protein BBOV_IV006620 [Babesia bovis T2Bo]